MQVGVLHESAGVLHNSVGVTRVTERRRRLGPYRSGRDRYSGDQGGPRLPQGFNNKTYLSPAVVCSPRGISRREQQAEQSAISAQGHQGFGAKRIPPGCQGGCLEVQVGAGIEQRLGDEGRLGGGAERLRNHPREWEPWCGVE